MNSGHFVFKIHQNFNLNHKQRSKYLKSYSTAEYQSISTAEYQNISTAEYRNRSSVEYKTHTSAERKNIN